MSAPYGARLLRSADPKMMPEGDSNSRTTSEWTRTFYCYKERYLRIPPQSLWERERCRFFSTIAATRLETWMYHLNSLESQTIVFFWSALWGQFSAHVETHNNCYQNSYALLQRRSPPPGWWTRRCRYWNEIIFDDPRHVKNCTAHWKRFSFFGTTIQRTRRTSLWGWRHVWTWFQPFSAQCEFSVVLRVPSLRRYSQNTKRHYCSLGWS